ncbi:unnamed protein product [Gordionus sp. m RMFG-2023]|uniref:DNA-directed RNA polymerase III subunit RPC6-like isoform X2 n=1 Tax=Gordionus sp. m RMFG-2023 TaxID=3053472 RepID=UPI0030E39B8A
MTEQQDKEKIINYLKKNVNGVSDKTLRKNFIDIDPKNIVNIINLLLNDGSLNLLKSSNNTLIYKYNNVEKNASQLLEESDEKLVYQIIKDSGNKGIWIRDIRYKSNLLLAQLNKIVKNLETLKLVKSIKAISASKKKLYMLYEIEPDQSLTGGSWYSDQDFESEFVEILNNQCLKYIYQEINSRKKSFMKAYNKIHPLVMYVSSVEILKHITDLGISKISLSLDDIEMIMETLFYDNCVEKIIVSQSLLPLFILNNISEKANDKLVNEYIKLYKTTQSFFPFSNILSDIENLDPINSQNKISGLFSVPCGICPTFNKCSTNGYISPITCSYMGEWLKY